MGCRAVLRSPHSLNCFNAKKPFNIHLIVSLLLLLMWLGYFTLTTQNPICLQQGMGDWVMQKLLKDGPSGLC